MDNPTCRNAFVYCDQLDQYPYPADCPFDTSRAGRTRQTLVSMGKLTGADKREVVPRKASRLELEAYHSPPYLDALERASRREHDLGALMMGIGTADCPIFDGLYDYAEWAAGASLTAARLVIDGEAEVAFNPSGGYHHAHTSKAGGFCYVNDIVLACMALAESGRRVAFLDIDVHHCDGVQAAFEARRDVLTISLHETGKSLFPGTGFETDIGVGEGRGYSVNLPLPAGLHDHGYMRAFRRVALPVLRAYAPDVVVLEVGADALAGDPLAHLNLTNNVYADVIGDVRDLHVPIVATGGGGYHVQNTVRAWALTWIALCGEDNHQDELAGMGGVMLETTDWHAGLRDRLLAPSWDEQRTVEEALEATIAAVRQAVFPFHGL